MTRIAAIFLSAALALPAAAQDAATLGDIRADIDSLSQQLQSLKGELSGGGSGLQVAGSTLERVDAIEAALQRLTSRAEELEFRVNRVVEDGTNRIGDLKFRLCEVEPGCDIGAVSDTPPLGEGAPAAGGSAGIAPVPTPAPAPAGEAALGGVPTDGSATVADIETGGAATGQSVDTGAGQGADAPLPLSNPDVQLAATEEQDYRRAREALASGDFQSAADQFATFRQTYPGGPLEAAALLGRGRALEGLGETREAARAYLDVYSGFPDSPSAPEALWRLGAKLGELGSTREACVTLAEVPNRYPGTDAVARAAEARSGLACQ